MQLLVRINPVVAVNSIIHQGEVIMVPPMRLIKGHTIITPDGIGEIKTILPDFITKQPQYLDVYILKKYVKRYRVLDVLQCVVFHKPNGQFIELSPENYRYIYKNHQFIEYRDTNRGYAQLTPNSKLEYSHIKTINKQKGGLSFLKVIEKNNFEIKKKK